MSPALLATILVACLLALLPVWRLRVAGWPAGWLLAAWFGYAAALVLVVRFPGPFRFLLPILVVAVLAPFVAGPERLVRVLHRRRGSGRATVDVTPKPPPPLPEPPRDPDDDRPATG